MTNIDYFIEALKAGWLRRIFDEKNKGLWKEYYLEKLNDLGGNFILECNLNSIECNLIAKDNIFLGDILSGRSKINTLETTNIAKQIIWNNSNTKCDNKILFYRKWFEQGIKSIEHIYDFRIKQFYTIEQLKNLYIIPQNDFLKYHNIVSNIKSEWKSKSKNEECNLLPHIQNKVLQIITEQNAR